MTMKCAGFFTFTFFSLTASLGSVCVEALLQRSRSSSVSVVPPPPYRLARHPPCSPPSNFHCDVPGSLVPHRHYYYLSLGSSTSSSDKDNDDDAARLQKSRMSSLYDTGKYLFGSMGLLLLFMPDRTLTTLLAAKLGGAAGFGIASGLCHILEGANHHDRLNSDTYKRLNLGLLGFNFISLFAVPGEAAFLPEALPAIVLTSITWVLHAYGCVLAYLGWKRGVQRKGADTSTTTSATGSTILRDMITDLAQGTKETLQGLKVQNKKKSLTYRNCLLLVCFGAFNNFMEGIFDIQFRDRFLRTWFEISLQWSAIGRLFMIATMIYSLKDAAERDRLTGTTFIQLNVMIGIWSAIVGLGQSIYPLGFAASRGVFMYSFSLPFLTKALKSQKEKDMKKKGKPLEHPKDN